MGCSCSNGVSTMKENDIVAIILLAGLVICCIIGFISLVIWDIQKKNTQFLKDIRSGTEGVFEIECREQRMILNSIYHALGIKMINNTQGILMSFNEKEGRFIESKSLMPQPSIELKCLPVKDPKTGIVVYSVSKDKDSNFYLEEFYWKDQYYISWGYTEMQAYGAAIAYCLKQSNL